MNKGFTLVELIAVVAILGLLAIITTPAYDTISKNIKHINYESKANTIKKQTLSYVEKYLKDKIYAPPSESTYCFTVEYLIQNGIISSDDEKEEYIENNETGDKYSKTTEYVKVYYDKQKFKLIALIKDIDADKNDFRNKICSVTL